MDIKNILLNRYQDETLASVYIAHYDSKSTNVEKWISDFLLPLTSMEDHPDVLKVKRSEKENEYKVDSNDIVTFLKFINYRPLKLKKKFIFLYDAHLLSIIVSNKLLKVFEELGDHYCLFLMVPDKAPLLATVESRGIKIRLSPDITSDGVATTLDLTQFKNPNELLAYIKKQNENNSNNLEKNFIQQTIEKTLKESQNNPDDFKRVTELLQALKDFEVSSDFNNSKLSRITSLFS